MPAPVESAEAHAGDDDESLMARCARWMAHAAAAATGPCPCSADPDEPGQVRAPPSPRLSARKKYLRQIVDRTPSPAASREKSRPIVFFDAALGCAPSPAPLPTAAPDVPSSPARSPPQPTGCAHVRDDQPHHRENADNLWWLVALAVWAFVATLVAIRFRLHARLREAAEREAAVADFLAAVDIHRKETALDAVFVTATLPCGSPAAAKRCPDEEQTPSGSRDGSESEPDADANPASASGSSGCGWGVVRAFVVSSRRGGDPWTEALRRARREPGSATTRTLRMATMALTRTRWSRGKLTRNAFEREAARLGWRVEPLTGRILAVREGTMVRPYDHSRVRANV